MKLERMPYIAKVAYEEQHLERLDRMEMIENQMWHCYWREKDHSKRVKILSEIANIQPFISSYYEVTKTLLENRDSKLKDLEQKGGLEEQYQDTRPTIFDIEDLNGVENIPSDSWKDWLQC